MSALQRLTQLKRLRYWPEKSLTTNPPTLRSIGSINSLTRLELPSVVFPPGEFAQLSDLGNLEALHFGGPVSEQDARNVARLVGLRELYLENPGLNDAALAHFASLTNLEWLQVGGPFTDHGLAPLAKLKNLVSLNLNSQTVSSQELRWLNEQLPRLYRLSAPNHPHFIGESANRSLIGHAAPDFEVLTRDGKRFKLSEYRGRPVLVHFWATWCGPCIRELPQREQFYKDLRSREDRFEMIGLSVDSIEDGAKWKQLVEQHALSSPQARIGPGSKIGDAYRVLGAGAQCLVSPTGVVLSDSSDLRLINELVSQTMKATR
jgi:peroxiredoxin